MKGERINFAMGDIGDDIIIEAENVDMKKISALRRRKKLIMFIAAAVSVSILSGAVYAADVLLTKGKSVFQQAAEEDIPYESLEEYPDIKYSEVDENDVQTDEKTAVYEKMLNTIDYYTHLKVVFETDMIEEGPVTIECQTDIPDSLAYEAYFRNGGISFEYFVDGKTVTFFNRETGERRSNYGKVYSMETSPKIPLEERITVMEEDGLPCYNRRGNATNCAFAPYAMYPQDIAYSFLKDFDRWDITGHDEILGRKCAVITGTLGQYGSSKHGFDSFTLYVDSETGVLMKLSGISDGETVKYIEVTECDYGAADIPGEFIK